MFMFFFDYPNIRYFIKKSVVSSSPIHSSYAKHMQKEYSESEMKTVAH